MRKGLFFLLAISLMASVQTKADEGMWLLSLVGKLNIQQMQSMGLKLDADQIYHVNHSSLKDAVVALDYGSCTAEIVSPDGLLLTNHHCGFDDIQKHSTLEHDYLKDGFWAKSKDQELPNPGKTVTFLIRMEDVTDKVLKEVTDTTSAASRQEKIQKAISALEKEAKGNSSYDVRIRPLFEGNVYFLFVTETFRDIRLVGTPPQSIGKFGGETDNWMWPRHTGDFSMFRIYCSPDGKPADYAKNNVPYHPKHYLPVSIKGVGMEDYAMIIGYPGRTNRYVTSFGVKYTTDVTNAIRIKVREARLNIIKDYMALGEKNRLQYASKFAGSSNYYKYSIGENAGLSALKVLDQKQSIEKEFTAWVNADQSRKVKYGKVLQDISDAYRSLDDKVASEYSREVFFGGPEVIRYAFGAMGLARDLESGDKARIATSVEKVKSSVAEFYRDFDTGTDEKIAAVLFKMYADNVAAKYHPTFMAGVSEKNKGDFGPFVKKMYKKSIFRDQKSFEAFLKNPTAKGLLKDPVYSAVLSITETMKVIGQDMRANTATLDNSRRLFVAGLLEMNKGKMIAYPDANSTMRLTYGKVGDYDPRDGVHYKFFTTLKGYEEKGIAGDADFDYPQHLIDLLHAKNYGPYADADGTLHTCFTTNNDITGGNSGSPVINGKGELIGIAFDGNWEAMSGNIAFEPNLQKCINVDIRFVLWIIDVYAGAKNLVDEMTIVR
ncbi:MAG: S46 family peptidase [Marinilabiliales bacterium]|nr:S46 family peptidase [Marinilabiliales bacterium]